MKAFRLRHMHAAFYTSGEGQTLNKGKEPDECLVLGDGSLSPYCIKELTEWLSSPFIPENFKITPDSKVMFMAGKSPSVVFEGVTLPIATYQDKDGRLEAVELACLAPDGSVVTFQLSLKDINNDLKKVKTTLSSYRLAYYQGTESLLMRFMVGCANMELMKSIYLVEQAGFVPEKQVYVTHDATLSREDGHSAKRCRYRLRKQLEQLSSRGLLEAWKRNVAEPVRQFPIMVFSILAMLTNVLINLLQKSSTIVHVHGLSSVGKTTLAMLAQSTVGRATDPSEDGSSAIRKWHNTFNALTSLIEMHHGMGLVLDELGSFTGRNFSSLIYAMTNGQSKGRCDKDSLLIEAQNTAALCIFSTGEMSSDDFLRKLRDSVNSGARVRMLNIEILQDDARLPGETLAQAKARIDQIKAACGTDYGTAFPALAQGLLNLPEAISHEALRLLAQNRVAQCAERLVPLVDGAADSPLVHRGLDFFAMTLATVLYGIELGGLPFTESEALNAVVEGANRWAAPLREMPDDVSLAAHGLLNTLIRNRQMFPDIDSVKESKRMGLARGPNFLVCLSWFDELVPQYGKQVIEWLEKHGYLRPGPDKKYIRLRNTSRNTKYRADNYYALDHDKVMGFTGGIEEIDGYEGASRNYPSSASSFTRSATSETGGSDG
ncbi:DUF927 domain-containing protein [Aeromonas salmonicida]|uniref:DUF927 domain-containing protein n=1 Tax=Aeromonas salmonicida TaxID=645 RepID=UPI0024A7F568|nr:DUF927 domain-containing protein [Aeromonas salmonicida]MDM5135021.1 DUF927 domain-containing protein [Aeromonas salmonicida]WHF41135.1 DUF927 domain-containing protein [Aeromonas salmonicida]